MPSFGFCGSSYTSESPNVAANKTVNWYPERVEEQGNTPVAMYPSPGLEPFANIAGNAVRGMYEFNGRLFAVGANFAEIFSDGHVAGYSFLPVDNNPVSMAANNANQLIICTGGQLWLFPLAAGSIIYTNVPSTINTVRIVDNGNPAVKDYYIDTVSLAGYAVGSSVVFAGLTLLTFLNGVNGTIMDIVGNTVHMQLPRSLTTSFFQAINAINIFVSTSSSGTPQLPPTFADSVPVDVAWSTPGGVIGTGSFASATFTNVGGLQFSDILRGQAFGFALPAGAIVDGIQFDFEIQSTSTSVPIQNVQAQIYKGGVAVGSVPGTPIPPSAVFQTVTFGSSTDLWGTTWTDADINGTGFNIGTQVILNYGGATSHLVKIRNYLITVTWHLTIYSATVTFTSAVSPFMTAGQPLTFSGLTNAPLLNGNTYPMVTAVGNQATVVGVPGPVFSGAESGGVTGQIINYGPSNDTGTISGTVISVSVNPVQVAIGQGPFIQVDFVDGYFLALRTNSQIFQISGLEDGTTWDPIDSFQVLQYADNITSMIVNQRQVWFLGPKRTLVYYDTGDALIPFQPIPGAFIEQGIGAQWSVCRMDNSIVWLGRDERGNCMAWRANGYTPQRISNHAVENVWRQYPTISNAIGYTYQQNGNTFWQIWFPSAGIAGETWVYDASTGQWHEKIWLRNGIYLAHRSRSQAFAFDKVLVGDWVSGTIYNMAIENQFDHVDGVNYPIQRIRRAPHISNEQKWTFHQQMQVYIESGIGAVPTAAQIFIRWSDDGTHTWSNYYGVSVGALGEYSTRCMWRRLGRSRDRVYELMYVGATPLRIVDAYLQVVQGP